MIKRLKIQLLLFSILIIFISTVSDASPIAKTWIYSTVLIENEWGTKGTGFLVSRKLSNNKLRVFLCTNKHVLNKNKELRDKATKIILHMNIEYSDGQIAGKAYTVNLIDSMGNKIWKEHLDKDVDVLVFHISSFFNIIPDILFKVVSSELFINDKILAEEEITIGDDIMILGYPLGFTQGKTNFPIVRQGIIASQIGQSFVNELQGKDGKLIKKTYRGFLIDGGIISGSSGSPVILKPVTGRRVGKEIKMSMAQPYLLGIVSETRFAPIRTNKGVIPSYAGLGIAFDTSTIKETIDLFFN